jgi:hypothetical protein
LSFPNLSKVFQATPSHFLKKRLFIICPLSPKSIRGSGLALAFPHPMMAKPANSKRKSTVAYPKSTVDLRSQPLIWIEKRSANAPFVVSRHSFSPIKTWQSKRASRLQTDTGQKLNPSTIDLGYKKQGSEVAPDTPLAVSLSNSA